MYHGTQDSVIPIARAQESRDWLVNVGFKVEWKEYPMGHEVCLPEINYLSGWLQKRLA